jgi:hypothetical protein
VTSTHHSSSGSVADTGLSRDGIGKVGTAGGSDSAPKRRLSSQDRRRVETKSVRDLSLPRDVGGHDGLGTGGTENRVVHARLEEEVRERSGPVGGGVGSHVRRLSITRRSGRKLRNVSSSEASDRVVYNQVLSSLEDRSKDIGTGRGERVELDSSSGTVGDGGRVLGLLRRSRSSSGLGSDLQNTVLLAGTVSGTDRRSEGVDDVEVVVHLPDPLRVRGVGRGQLGATGRVELTEVRPHLVVLAFGGCGTERSQGGDDSRGRDVVLSETGQGVEGAGDVVQRLDTALETGVSVEALEVFLALVAETSRDHSRGPSGGSTSRRRGFRCLRRKYISVRSRST